MTITMSESTINVNLFHLLYNTIHTPIKILLETRKLDVLSLERNHA